MNLLLASTYFFILLIAPLLLSYIIVRILAPLLIPYLHKLKFGQSIREEGPSSHQKKAGTPTMGGLLFVPAIIISSLVLPILEPTGNMSVWLVLLLFIGHFAIGFLDDYIKIVLKRNLGLKAREKIIAQLLLSCIFAYFFPAKDLWIPLVNTYIDLGLLYYPFVFIVIIGTTNAVNLTDGLDGLLSGVTLPVAAVFAFICLLLNDIKLAMICLALFGACLGFLKFNSNPAKVFMGDTGSLALGGIIAGIALTTNTTLLLVVIGAVYVMEALSVIMQVISFKTTGKRIFKMSPIHHHFELSGWSEKKVVNVFVLVSCVFSVLGAWIFVLTN